MDNIIIIGTGAVAAEITSYIEDSSMGKELNLRIKGYLGDDEHTERLYQEYKYTKPLLGRLTEYDVKEGDNFVIAAVNAGFREKILNLMIPKGAKFPNLIHPTAIIASTADIGIGNVINPYCIVGPNVKIGNFNILTSQTFISHDCSIGDGNSFSTAILCGYVSVGSNNKFYIKSTVIPGISIGDDNTIQAGMLVDKNIGNEETVFYRFKERIMAIPKA